MFDIIVSLVLLLITYTISLFIFTSPSIVLFILYQKTNNLFFKTIAFILLVLGLVFGFIFGSFSLLLFDNF